MTRQRGEKGQTLVAMVLSMTVVIGFLGLGIDFGYLRSVKGRMQSAADAAALAGASELRYGDAVAAGKADSATNGFADGVSGVTVTVNNPPQTSTDPHYNDSNYVEAIVSQSVSTHFARIFGVQSVVVQARSEAHLGSSPDCMYTLNPTAQNALLANGSTVHSQCGIVDDSSASQALLFNGSTVSATSISVVGGDNLNGSTVTPTPVTGAASGADPLAYLPKPTVGSCQYTNKQVNGTSAVLSQGVYCSGLLLNGSTVTLNPGLYIISGGSFQVNGSSVTGNGVTFYITNNASVVINGGNTVSLIAQTTGTYAGILFFQDPSDTQQATLNGSNPVYQGAMYFPAANLLYNGCAASTAYSILVASTLQLNGTNYINNDYSSLPGGSPIRGGAVLAE